MNAHVNAASTNDTIMPGPAFCAASADNTKMPVPITVPTPSITSWKAPSVRPSGLFSAAANRSASGLMRQFIGPITTQVSVRRVA